MEVFLEIVAALWWIWIMLAFGFAGISASCEASAKNTYDPEVFDRWSMRAWFAGLVASLFVGVLLVSVTVNIVNFFGGLG